MTYSVTLFAYCGMSIPLGSGYTYAEARERAKQRIESFKRRIGGPVTVLVPNKKWELGEPENCSLVPDGCGILKIEKGASTIL